MSHSEIDLVLSHYETVLSHYEILKSQNETFLSHYGTKTSCNLLFYKGLCVPYYIII